MKLRIYFDTSVFSAYYDDRVTDRQAQTEALWARLAAYEASSSELARTELAQTPDPILRQKLSQLLDGLIIHPLTSEMKELADRYFDYEPIAAEAGIPPDQLTALARLVREEFPRDDMMYELHVLRICLAIRDGRLSAERALKGFQTA